MFHSFALSDILIVGTKCVCVWIEKFLEIPNKREFTQYMYLYSGVMPPLKHKWKAIQKPAYFAILIRKFYFVQC